jgi:hypothetical protein
MQSNIKIHPPRHLEIAVDAQGSCVRVILAFGEECFNTDLHPGLLEYLR